MDKWPLYIRYALGKMIVSSPYDEAYIAEFVERWGGIDIDSISKALTKGTGNDKLFALFAFAASANPAFHDQLAPLLRSDHSLERWASAICLGSIKDEAALPILCEMLEEFLPPDVPLRPDGNREWLFSWWRNHAPILLGGLGNSAASPFLRHALQRTIIIQADSSVNLRKAELRNLVAYQHHIVYALGRLDAFGSLINITELKDDVAVWQVHLLMGHLHGRYPLTFIPTWDAAPEMKEEVALLLLKYFGLDQQEQEYCLRQYQRQCLGPFAISFEATFLFEKEHSLR